jgi:hypothetical protein
VAKRKYHEHDKDPVAENAADRDVELSAKLAADPLEAYRTGAMDGVSYLENFPFPRGWAVHAYVKRESGPDEGRGVIYNHRDLRDTESVARIPRHTALSFGPGRYSVQFIPRSPTPLQPGTLRTVSFTLTADTVRQFQDDATEEELEAAAPRRRPIPAASAAEMRSVGQGRDPVNERLDRIEAVLTARGRTSGDVDIERFMGLAKALGSMMPQRAPFAELADAFREGVAAARGLTLHAPPPPAAEEKTIGERVIEILAETALPDHLAELAGAVARKLGAPPSASPTVRKNRTNEAAARTLADQVLDAFEAGMAAADLAATIKPALGTTGELDALRTLAPDQLAEGLAEVAGCETPSGLGPYCAELQNALGVG